MPGDLSVCMFVCSGSEANDLAWRLAKAHTGNAGGIVTEHAYHGTTDAVYELSPADYGVDKGRILAEHIATVPAPDGYRGRFRRDDPRYVERYAECLDDAIASLDEAQSCGQPVPTTLRRAVEAMLALVLMDHVLRQRAQNG